MKYAPHFNLSVGLFVFCVIMGCGSSSTAPSSQSVGSDIIKQYSFHIEGEPTATSINLPQEFAGPDWGLKENLCQMAGYSLTSYAGQIASLVVYNISEKYYESPERAGLPLSLVVLAKEHTTICGYLSNSGLIPGAFALNDPNVK